jgi:hypothetical protein
MANTIDMISFVLKTVRFPLLIIVFLLSVFISEKLTAQNKKQDSILVIPVSYSIFQRKTSIPVDIYPADFIAISAGEKIVYYKADNIKLKGRISKIGSSYLIIDSLKVNLSEIIRVYDVRLVNPAFILSAQDYKIYYEKIVMENQKYFKVESIQPESINQMGTEDSILVIATKFPLGPETTYNIPIEPGPKNFITYAQGNKMVYYKSDGIKYKGTIYKVGADYLIIESMKIPVKEIKQVGKVHLKYEALVVSKNDYRNMQLGLYHYKNKADSNDTEKQKGIKYENRKANTFNRRNREYLYPHSLTFNIFEPVANQATITYGYRVNRYIGIDVSPGFYFQTDQQNSTIPHLEYADIHPGFQYQKNRLKGYQLNLGLKIYFNNKPNRYFELLGFGRYWYYNNEKVLVYFHQDDYYRYANQSEQSWVVGLNLIYGWQLTFKNKITTDFFFGLGYFERSGNITEYSGGFHPYDQHPIVYPHTYYNSASFFSFQGGVKIGLRFGKRKTAAKDLSFE